MKNTFKKVFIGFMAFAMATGSFAQQRAHKKDNESYPKEWKQIARMEQDSFFLTDEARRIAENVLAFQRCTGGWPKNIDMARRMNDKELAKVIKDKSRRDDSTIDNNATTAQMIFLARLYRQTKDIRYRDAFLQGVEYLLSGQYENGGWPQFWPGPRGYQVHITFNDDAIVNTLNMIRDMMNHKAPYEDDLIDKALCVRLGKAFNKGIECILATQIIKDGEPSVWCQQNDRETLKPAPARAYELPSYCSAESAGIVRLLMELPAPDARVKRAVHGAMKWFDRYKLTGLKCERIVLANGERDTRLVEDPQAKPIWARYYDLKYCEPYVCDRDGLPRRHLEEIGTERRNGYSWYNSRPAELFAIYNAWADKYDPKHKVAISLATKGANENGLIEMYRRPMAERTAFENVCYKNLKDAGLPDHIAWMKAAAQKYPYMDVDRVGIYGCSAGGQESTNAVLLYPDFYKAAYSACGCHDNRMDKIWWNELWLGYPVGDQYKEGSNVENAHLLSRPLMLVVGELDDNVDPASTMQVVNALIKANKDFELVVIPGAHHTMGEDFGEHKRYDFFVRHLMQVNPPKWDEIK